MKKIVLITGANGFIGQNLVPRIIKKFPDYKIIGLIGKTDKLHEKKGLQTLSKMRIDLLPIDLLNKQSLKKLPQSPDIVVHLASAVDTSMSDFSVNDQGTQNLIDGLRLKKSSHFIYTSTSAVWGGRTTFNFLHETTPAMPNNEYGRTKYIGEQLLTQRSKKTGFKLTILRLNTVYGSDLREDKLFGMVQKMVTKDSFISRINWPGKFGVVHVDDVCKAILNCMKYQVHLKNQNLWIISTENVSLPYICQLMYKHVGIQYKPLKFPQWFWTIVSFIKYFNPFIERLLPSALYNLFWRVSLITNDVLKADGTGFQEVKTWKRKKLKKYIKDVFI